MKILFYCVAILLIVSCEKDDIDSVSSYGFLESYLNNNPKIEVQKTNESSVSYDGGSATYRGYIFKPSNNIRIKAIGGLIAEPGTYKIEFYNLYDNYLNLYYKDTLFIDSINIKTTNGFQFKNIYDDVVLNADNYYLIRYFNKNHNSVYDVGLGYRQQDPVNMLYFPLIIDEIEIVYPYYTYEIYYYGKYYTGTEGIWNQGILRGIVDFKYELIN